MLEPEAATLRRPSSQSAIGESQQVVNNWKRRGAIPGRKLAKVAGALGVTLEGNRSASGR
jgi:hypothetical protein